MRGVFVVFILAILAFQITEAKSQTARIVDSGFNQCLVNKYPHLLSSNGELNIGSAQTQTALVCDSLAIRTVEDLTHFSNLEVFIFNNNSITSLKPIQHLTKLKRIEAKTNLLSEVPDFSGYSSLTVLNLYQNYLTSLPGLDSLKSLKELYVHENRLESIPSLDSLKKLEVVYIGKNNLKSVPSFTYLVNLVQLSLTGLRIATFPDLSNNLKLERLFLDNNQLTEISSLNHLQNLSLLFLQNNRLTKLPELSNLNLSNFVASYNELSSVPDLSHMTNLKVFGFENNFLTSAPSISPAANISLGRLDNNYLTFSDLSSYTSRADFGNFVFAPQRTFPSTPVTHFKTEGETFSVDLFSESRGSEQYFWYFNDSLYSNHKELTIAGIQEKNEGSYSLVVKSLKAEFAGLEIRYSPITLSVNSFFTTSGLEVEKSKVACNSAGGKLVLTKLELPSGYFLESYVLKRDGKVVEFSTNGIFQNVPAGTYTIELVTTSKDVFSYPDLIILEKQEGCENVFSPNGDGIADEFYIYGSGKAKVINENGNTVTTLTLPVQWDGKDQNGNSLPSGPYFVVKEDNKDLLPVFIIR